MKHTIRSIAAVLFLSLLSVLPAAAQTSFFDSAPASAPEASESGDSDFGTFSSSVPALEWSGRVFARSRAYIDESDMAESTQSAAPGVNLDMKYQSEKVDLTGKFLFDRTHPESEEILQDLIDEAYIRAYFDGFDLEAGYMKVVWGKGDDVHVLDVLNPTDYYDFLNNDYLERRESEIMLRLLFRIGDASTLEMVWEPTTTPDLIPLEGYWTPYIVTSLESLLPSGTDLPLEEESLNRISDGTYGLRWSTSLSGWDLGLLYSYTFDRLPSVDFTRYLSTGKVYLSYDRMHVFGAEAASVVGGFNLRAEAGYFLTDDISGDDPRVKNNRIGYVLGFDRNIGSGGLNLNAQVQGLVPLSYGKIDEVPTDTEYADDGIYTDHVVVIRLSDTFDRERIKAKITYAFGIEHQDWRLAPELSFEPETDLLFTARYVKYFGDDDTNFGQYENSSFAEIGMEFKF